MIASKPADVNLENRLVQFFSDIRDETQGMHRELPRCVEQLTENDRRLLVLASETFQHEAFSDFAVVSRFNKLGGSDALDRISDILTAHSPKVMETISAISFANLSPGHIVDLLDGAFHHLDERAHPFVELQKGDEKVENSVAKQTLLLLRKVQAEELTAENAIRALQFSSPSTKSIQQIRTHFENLRNFYDTQARLDENEGIRDLLKIRRDRLSAFVDDLTLLTDGDSQKTILSKLPQAFKGVQRILSAEIKAVEDYTKGTTATTFPRISLGISPEPSIPEPVQGSTWTFQESSDFVHSLQAVVEKPQGDYQVQLQKYLSDPRSRPALQKVFASLSSGRDADLTTDEKEWVEEVSGLWDSRFGWRLEQDIPLGEKIVTFFRTFFNRDLVKNIGFFVTQQRILADLRAEEEEFVAKDLGYSDEIQKLQDQLKAIKKEDRMARELARDLDFEIQELAEQGRRVAKSIGLLQTLIEKETSLRDQGLTTERVEASHEKRQVELNLLLQEEEELIEKIAEKQSQFLVYKSQEVAPEAIEALEDELRIAKVDVQRRRSGDLEALRELKQQAAKAGINPSLQSLKVPEPSKDKIEAAEAKGSVRFEKIGSHRAERMAFLSTLPTVESYRHLEEYQKVQTLTIVQSEWDKLLHSMETLREPDQIIEALEGTKALFQALQEKEIVPPPGKENLPHADILQGEIEVLNGLQESLRNFKAFFTLVDQSYQELHERIELSATEAEVDQAVEETFEMLADNVLERGFKESFENYFSHYVGSVGELCDQFLGSGEEIENKRDRLLSSLDHFKKAFDKFNYSYYSYGANFQKESILLNMKHLAQLRAKLAMLPLGGSKENIPRVRVDGEPLIPEATLEIYHQTADYLYDLEATMIAELDIGREMDEEIDLLKKSIADLDKDPSQFPDSFLLYLGILEAHKGRTMNQLLSTLYVDGEASTYIEQLRHKKEGPAEMIGQILEGEDPALTIGKILQENGDVAKNQELLNEVYALRLRELNQPTMLDRRTILGLKEQAQVELERKTAARAELKARGLDHWKEYKEAVKEGARLEGEIKAAVS